MSTINFSYDPEWLDTLSAPFMTNAFIAGLCIALAAGVMGYFTIARHSTFAAHALAHIGLPGATGAVLLGLPVSLGMGVFALGGALVIGALGKRVSEREIATGTVLAFATGLGLFFARLSSSASQQMQSILFGSILTITTGQIIGFAVFDVLLLALLAIIYRPLLFSSLDEQVAQAKGVPIGLMNVAFMAIMAGVITIAVPAVGTLLIFALVITPAATANILAGSPFKAMVIASVLCLVSIWAGLVLSAMFPAPPSFIIVTLSTLFWAIAKAVETVRKSSHSFFLPPLANSQRGLCYIFSTKALAMAAMPSPRPVNPIWSVVVAVTDTGQPTAADRAASASARRVPIFGRLPMITTEADAGVYPLDARCATTSCSISMPCLPAPCASAPTPNSEPMSPNRAAASNASIRACAATSPSESPSIPSYLAASASLHESDAGQ